MSSKNRINRKLGSAFALVVSLSTMGHAELMQVAGVPVGDSLNVRSASNANSADIGDLHEGDIIDVKGLSFDGKWSQVSFNGQNAWVASRYLIPVHGEELRSAIGPNVVSGISENDADGGLVIRSGPAFSEAPLGVLPNGTQVHIIQLSRDQKWGMIALANSVGWVSTRYLVAVQSPGAPQQGSITAPDGGPLPAAFIVAGVNAGDQLWVRQMPNATAPRIGGLLEAAVVMASSRAHGNWVQVTVNGQVGYVNARYLVRYSEGASQTTNGFPLGLTCRGTEPFWTLTIAQDRTTQFTSLIGGPDPIASLSQATPSIGGGYPFDFVAGPYSGALDSQSCSDGMSDLSYSMRITLMRQDPNGENAQLYGCCNVD